MDDIDRSFEELNHEIEQRVYIKADMTLEDGLFLLGGAVYLIMQLRRARGRLQAALAVGNQMMGTMSGPTSPANDRYWLEFELALAGLVNDGLLKLGETTDG